jgi:hypothetical protein
MEAECCSGCDVFGWRHFYPVLMVWVVTYRPTSYRIPNLVCMKQTTVGEYWKSVRRSVEERIDRMVRVDCANKNRKCLMLSSGFQ